MRANVVKTVVNSVPHEGIDAVGVERTIPENPLRRKSDQKHWYIAIVNNKSEKLCRDKLEKRIASQPEGEKDYEVYIASQKEMCLLPSGKRKQVDRIVFRRKEIVHLPYIKRFMVNIAGERSGGIRPVAFIPDEQMVKLRRMLDDSEEPVIIDPRPLPLGARVRINGGKLHGLEGNVLEVEDGNLNFVIRVDLLGCAKVNITRDLLELL